MSKKIPLIGLIIILITIAIYYVFYGSNQHTDQITLYGNVELKQVALAFNASERITHLTAEEGDWVKKGQLLGQLDTRTLLVEMAKANAQIKVQEAALSRLQNGSRPEEIAQAKADVEAANANVSHSKALYNRLLTISKTTNGQGVSKQDVDEARSAYNRTLAQLTYKRKALELAEIGPRHEDIAEASAQLEIAKAQLALLERQQQESRLLSPVNATVRARLLEQGDMASPQRPVYTLAITDPKWVRAYIPESELGKVKLGMPAQVIIDSYPNNSIEGQVGFISSNAEFTPKNVQTEELRTSLVYELRIYVKDPDNKLKLGMPVTVHLPLNSDHE